MGTNLQDKTDSNKTVRYAGPAWRSCLTRVSTCLASCYAAVDSEHADPLHTNQHWGLQLTGTRFFKVANIPPWVPRLPMRSPFEGGA